MSPTYRDVSRYLVIPRTLDDVHRHAGILAYWTVRCEYEPDRRGVLQMAPHPELGLPERYFCGCGGTSFAECVHIAAAKDAGLPMPPDNTRGEDMPAVAA